MMPKRRLHPGWVVALALVLVLALVGLRRFVAEPRRLVSGSMAPTFEVDDVVVVEKVSYRLRSPVPGEIVAFVAPEGPRPDARVMIKRVVAVPGQEVAVRDGRVWIDGAALDEPWITEPPTYAWGPERVPDRSLFVLGDHRNGSADSHVWGFLSTDRLVGRVLFRAWPAL